MGGYFFGTSKVVLFSLKNCTFFPLFFPLLLGKLWSSPGVTTGNSSIFFTNAPILQHYKKTQFHSTATWMIHSCISLESETKLKPHQPQKLSHRSSKKSMSANFHELHSDKTETLITGPDHLHPSVQCNPNVRNLGVFFNSNLSFQ